MHGKQAVPLSYISVLCVTGNSCVCVCVLLKTKDAAAAYAAV